MQEQWIVHAWGPDADPVRDRPLDWGSRGGRQPAPCDSRPTVPRQALRDDSGAQNLRPGPDVGRHMLVGQSAGEAVEESPGSDGIVGCGHAQVGRSREDKVFTTQVLCSKRAGLRYK